MPREEELMVIFSRELPGRLKRKFELGAVMVPQEYGDKVRQARMRRGLDRMTTARHIGIAGVDSNYLSFLENGLLEESELTDEILRRIAVVLEF